MLIGFLTIFEKYTTFALKNIETSFMFFARLYIYLKKQYDYDKTYYRIIHAAGGN